MKKIALTIFCGLAASFAATVPAMAQDITVRYSQVDASYDYDDSDTKNDVAFSGPTVRLTGDLPGYNIKGVYGEIGYLQEDDTPYEADLLNLGAGLTRNLYRNSNFYIDGSIGLNASKYDADLLDDSLYYLGVPVKAQFGVQKQAWRGFIEVGYRHDWALNQSDDDFYESQQPSSLGGIELGAGIRYNMDYGWWTPTRR